MGEGEESRLSPLCEGPEPGVVILSGPVSVLANIRQRRNILQWASIEKSSQDQHFSPFTGEIALSRVTASGLNLRQRVPLHSQVLLSFGGWGGAGAPTAKST